jgi:hypothetical protein
MRRLRDPRTHLFKVVQQDLADTTHPFRPDVIQQARAAAWDGACVEDNPYLPDSRLARIWLEGFEGATSEIAKAEKDLPEPPRIEGNGGSPT